MSSEDLYGDLPEDVQGFLAVKRGEAALRGQDGHYDLGLLEQGQRRQAEARKEHERGSDEPSEDVDNERIGTSVDEGVSHVSYPDGSEYEVEDGKISKRKKN